MKKMFSGCGFIEFHGTLADLEQAVGLRIEREGKVFRAVPLDEVMTEETEVTAQMIEAGVYAYYENAYWGWDNPGNDALREMCREIFIAMRKQEKEVRE